MGLKVDIILENKKLKGFQETDEETVKKIRSYMEKRQCANENRDGKT